MKHFTKSDIANTLQLVAVLLLFGYPGCSPDKTSSKSSYSEKIPTVADTRKKNDLTYIVELQKSDTATRSMMNAKDSIKH